MSVEKDFENRDISRAKSDAMKLDTENAERSIEGSRDKPTEKKARSAKSEHSHRDKESSRHYKNKSSSENISHKSEIGSSKVLPTDPLIADTLNATRTNAYLEESESSHISALKKSISTPKLDNSEDAKTSKPKKERKREGNDNYNTRAKSSHRAEESRTTTETEASQDWEDIWKNKRKSDPAFWETAVVIPAARSSDDQNQTASLSDSIQNVHGNFAVDVSTISKVEERKGSDITAAIEGLLIADQQIEVPRPQVIQTISTR